MSEEIDLEPINSSGQSYSKRSKNENEHSCYEHGELCFGSVDGKRKYVRVNHNTDVKDLAKFLEEVWKLKVPNIIISVTGGAKNFKMQDKLTMELHKSLVKVAECTETLIITGGTNTGVMKMVGKVIQKRTAAKSIEVNTLGIATWGVIIGREALKKGLSSNKNEARDPVYYQVKKSKKDERGAYLDKNHSHFILVDDGDNDYGAEIVPRSNLEKHFATRCEPNAKVVCVMIQGGGNTLKTVYNALKNEIPVVVVDGTGGWANILAKICDERLSKTITENQIYKLIEDQGLRDEKTQRNISQWTNWAKECANCKDLVTIFRINSTDDVHELDIAILRAILSARQKQNTEPSSDHNIVENFRLALKWKRADIARSEILTDDVDINSINVIEVFKESLSEETHDFLTLLFDHGLKLNSSYEGILTQLFENMPKTVCQMLRESNLNAKTIMSVIGKRLMNPSSGKGDTFFTGNVNQAVAEQTVEPCQADGKDVQGKRTTSERYVRKFFICCLLENKRECARVLWEAMREEQLPACIIANRLLTAMATKVSVKEKKDEFLAHAEAYQNRSYKILTECYNDDPEKTVKSLQRTMDKWGCNKLTCLQVAVDANDSNFVSHPAVQLLLSKKWFGSINKELTSPAYSTGFIFLCIFIPVLIPIIIVFHKSQDAEKKPSQRALEDGNQETQKTEESLLKKIANEWSFYRSPIVKFQLSVVSHLLFLALFAYILLFNLFEEVSVFEWILLAWVVSLISDEVFQILKISVARWKGQFGNKLDVLSFILYLAGFILRFFYVDISRVILSIAFIVFCLRILSTFAVHEKLGPKILMVERMLEDLFFFIFILLVFMIAYGVASQSLLYPNESDVGTVFAGLLSKPYWNVYGELFLPEIVYNPTDEEFTCTSDPALIASGQRRCPEYNVAVPIMSAVYLLLANVLLLNLLIAMFSYSFDKLVHNTDIIWKYQRFGLVEEYYHKPPLVTPFSIFYNVYYFFRACCPKNKDTHTDVESEWESSCVESYLMRLRRNMKDTTEYKVNAVVQRLNSLSNKVDSVQNTMRIQKKAHKLVHKLEYKMSTMSESLQWLIYARTSENGPLVLKAVHQKARESPYPNTNITRTFLEDQEIPWIVPLRNYNPTAHTDEEVIRNTDTWADEELGDGESTAGVTLQFNKFDIRKKVNRKSHHGLYDVVDGLPRNPMGRTGLTGRGSLGRYGPNHAADAIVTRRKMNNGTIKKCCGKPVLEFIAIQREDTKQWSIPGGMVSGGENVSSAFLRKFKEKLDDYVEKDAKEADWKKDKEENFNKVKEFFSTEGVEIYKGYCDDHRNTDCAWVETIARNFHDENGTVFKKQFEKWLADESDGLAWKEVSESLELFADHNKYIEKVARIKNAYYKESERPQSANLSW